MQPFTLFSDGTPSAEIEAHNNHHQIDLSIATTTTAVTVATTTITKSSHSFVHRNLVSVSFANPLARKNTKNENKEKDSRDRHTQLKTFLRGSSSSRTAAASNSSS